jgi:hypothetical protein
MAGVMAIYGRLIILVALYGLFLEACSQPNNAPADELRLRFFSGWGETQIAHLKRNGQSSYQVEYTGGQTNRAGNLNISPGQFDAVEAQLRPLRASARNQDSMTVEDILNAGCAPDEPYVTDTGGLHIAWINNQGTFVTSVFYGCDPERNAARNASLRQMFDGLGIPGAKRSL